VLFKCSDVSEELTVSFFRVTELVHVDVEVIRKRSCSTL